MLHRHLLHDYRVGGLVVRWAAVGHRRDLVHDVHPRYDLAEDCIAPRKPANDGVVEHDEELGPGGIALAGPGHRNRSTHVIPDDLFVLDRVSGTAGSVALRVTSLDHESGDEAVEGRPV